MRALTPAPPVDVWAPQRSLPAPQGLEVGKPRIDPGAPGDGPRQKKARLGGGDGPCGEAGQCQTSLSTHPAPTRRSSSSRRSVVVGVRHLLFLAERLEGVVLDDSNADYVVRGTSDGTQILTVSDNRDALVQKYSFSGSRPPLPHRRQCPRLSLILEFGRPGMAGASISIDETSRMSRSTSMCIAVAGLVALGSGGVAAAVGSHRRRLRCSDCFR